MDRRERRFDTEEAIRSLVESMLARVWTAMPGIVQSFDASKMTVSVQPTVTCQYPDTTGQAVTLKLPVLLDCPVVWPGGGGATFTFPIASGDECLVVFASRCIDGWWSQGGVISPPEIRMHNLSDGFALVGVRNATRAYAPVSGYACLQSDDGEAYIGLDPTTHAVKAVAAGGINLNGVVISSAGLVTDGNGVQLGAHTHLYTPGSNTPTQTGPATG